jgi:hypothetical protein
MRDEKWLQTGNETAGIMNGFQGFMTQYGTVDHPQVIHSFMRVLHKIRKSA